jgi:hypothetical protein
LDKIWIILKDLLFLYKEIKIMKTKQTLEQYLKGWREAVKDIFITDELMNQFLKIKEKQYINKI